MKWPLLTLLIFICLACGGMLPGKVSSYKLKKIPPKSSELTSRSAEEHLHLSILEAKYLKEDRNLNLAIVRGMIMEFESRNPPIKLPDSLPDLKFIRKNSAFLSLEMTVEHLAHLESVKQNRGHSAYLNR